MTAFLQVSIRAARGELRTVLAGGLLLCLAFAAVETASAQTEAQWTSMRSISYRHVDSSWDCGLRKLETDAFVSHRPKPVAQRKATATILADYDEDMPIKAREAFQRAVEIWEAHISSPVPIRIDVRFEDLPPGVLAGAGPRLVVVDTTDNDQGDVVLGAPLLDARTGTNHHPQDPDIEVTFGTRDDWHYGTEPAPAGTVDFTTVALHEIGHGLNYVGLFRISGISGIYGVDFDQNGRIDEDERFAGAYDQHVTEERDDGSLFALTNPRSYSNPSPKLGDALRSDRLFFTGEKARQGARRSDGPSLPKLYAPNRFVTGSSISHLAEGAYPPETTNALMTPEIERAETVRLPGPVTCGQLLDMGWEAGPACALDGLVLSAPEGSVTDAQTDRQRSVRLNWELRGLPSAAASVDEFVVEQQQFTGAGSSESFVRRATVSAEGAQEYGVTLKDVKVGTHTFRITTAQKTTPPITTTVTVEAEHPDVSVYPNPFGETAKISFVLPEPQRVRVDVFDALGRRVATPFVGEHPAHTARPVSFDARAVSGSGSGVYFFRVTGETFTQTVKAARVQ